jgi:formylglycine-generating enzyme required for sulfatase activity
MTTLTNAAARLDRDALIRRYRRNRARTALLFASIAESAYYDRPIPLRHPFVFYEGHLPAFSYNKLMREALGKPSVEARLETLFERGIDPAGLADAKRHERDAWPARADVRRFADACDEAVLDALANADLTDASASPLLERGQAAFAILEHEEMHHETLTYIIHRLDPGRKTQRDGDASFRETPPAATGRAKVAAGVATLGARRDAAFAWDNELDEHQVDVPAFEVDVNNVTNGEWLAYVGEGGPMPSFWTPIDGSLHLRCAYGIIPLPLTWPVYVTHAQAEEYARRHGGGLMSEAQYHRAAFGTPAGGERLNPWGDEPPDATRHGNFDFRRYDPESVGASPGGASAWGIYDLVGNGFEWTSTEFAPFAGFTPLPSYPQYSADFFDGDHYVMKGASPVTAASLVRRSFRNWYRPEYPYMYSTFRVAYD